ncbi:MAG: hypothetical protein SynsKO_37690 [Synoicihabitans sp.]
MNSSYQKWIEVVGGGAALLIAGLAFSQLESLSSDGPEGDALRVGGIRELGADLRWVRTYSAWHRRDFERMRVELRWVTTLNPRPLVFWLNGARMLGYDVAAWRREQVGDSAAQANINREQWREAVAFLRLARQHHPDSAALWIEEAVISLRLLNAENVALHALARAQRCRDVPAFVPRVRAELLAKQNRLREASAVLRQALMDTGPREREIAAVLRVRLAEIEDQLKRDGI